MFTTNTCFTLKDRTPVAVGCMRLVYQHPENETLLIKVIRPEAVEERWGMGRAWYKRRRRYGRFSSYIREIQEYVAAWEAHGRSLHFVQKIVGFAETDMGLGLIVEAARDRSGNYARSLEQFLRAGEYTPEIEAALERVIEELLNSNIVISDPHAGNLVFAYSKEHGDHFVLIDGLGNNNILPFKFISRAINRRSKLRRFRCLRRYISTVSDTRFGSTDIPNPSS